MCFINQTPWTPHPCDPALSHSSRRGVSSAVLHQFTFSGILPQPFSEDIHLHGRKPGVPACPGPPLPAAATRTGLNIWPESVQSWRQPQELPCNTRTGMLALFHLGFEPGNSLPRTAGRQLATRRTCKVQSQQQKKKKTHPKPRLNLSSHRWALTRHAWPKRHQTRYRSKQSLFLSTEIVLQWHLNSQRMGSCDLLARQAKGVCSPPRWGASSSLNLYSPGEAAETLLHHLPLGSWATQPKAAALFPGRSGPSPGEGPLPKTAFLTLLTQWPMTEKF